MDLDVHTGSTFEPPFFSLLTKTIARTMVLCRHG